MADVIPHEFEETVDISTLKPHPANAREGDVGAIHTSLEAIGFYGAILAQKSTRRILAGHHRLLAAREAGIESLPTIWLDVDDATALAVLVGDNRTAELATWNDPMLLATLQQIQNDGLLAGTGYDGDDLDRLIADANPNFDPLDEPEGSRLDKLAPVTCPSCGHEFEPKK